MDHGLDDTLLDSSKGLCKERVAHLDRVTILYYCPVQSSQNSLNNKSGLYDVKHTEEQGSHRQSTTKFITGQRYATGL